MFTPIEGVTAAPPAYGLVAAAVRPSPDRYPKWELGLAWVQERCAVGYQLAPLCDEPPAYTAPGPVAAYYQPVEARWADECTTLSGAADLDRIRRLAEAQTSFVVARELWTGEGTQADPYRDSPYGTAQTTNAYLASPDATEVGGSAATARVAVGRLEQAALEAAGGQQVHLHLPVTVLPQLHGYITRIGQGLYTLAGNVVIADGGYPGTGPNGEAAGATVWGYATSPVTVLLSSVDVTTDDADTVDRATNTRTVWATRLFAATWDPCVHLATEITL